MNVVWDFSTTKCSSLCQYLCYHEFYQIFQNKLGKDERPFFSCLVGVALFPLCAIILENKLNDLGIKSLIFRVHLAIRRGSENLLRIYTYVVFTNIRTYIIYISYIHSYTKVLQFQISIQYHVELEPNPWIWCCSPVVINSLQIHSTKFENLRKNEQKTFHLEPSTLV